MLYSESATVPLHVCSVVMVDTSTVPGGFTWERFRHDIGERIKALPELRAKLGDSSSTSTIRCGCRTRLSTSTGT